MNLDGLNPEPSASGRRIVLATFGSFGDLHPYLAVALALKARGHRATVATSALYREKVLATGLEFAALRPDLPAPGTDPELIRRLMDPARGTERIVREVFMPAVRPMFEDLLAACTADGGADVLVSHPLVYPAPIVVAKTPGLRWASSHLAPIGFLSVHDPPVLPPFPGTERLRPLGPGFHRALFGLAKRVSRSWARPLDELRAEHGLPPVADPLFDDAHSPALVLALFSAHFAAPPPDWPPQTCVTGFPFHDLLAGDDVGLSTDLARFLDAGPPPVVFTLGTSAVRTAGDFFAQSLDAAEALGRRAVLLVGPDPRNRPARASRSDDVILAEYAPCSGLFPRAAAVVHQGGIGTTAQALRAGVPALVVPFAHDQPDNAARVRRLGVGRVLPRSRYRAARVAAELRALLNGETYARPARELGERIRRENGAETAAEVLTVGLSLPG